MKKAILTLATALTLVSGIAFADERTAGAVIDDTTVTAKVKAALIADPVTKAHQISVDTYKGKVKLSGFVDTAEAKARAVEVADEHRGGIDGGERARNSTIAVAGGASEVLAAAPPASRFG